MDFGLIIMMGLGQHAAPAKDLILKIKISTLLSTMNKYWPSYSCESSPNCHGGTGLFWEHEWERDAKISWIGTYLGTQQREATLQATLQAEVQERRRKEAEMETRQLEMQQQISQLMKFFQSSSGSFPRSSSPP